MHSPNSFREQNTLKKKIKEDNTNSLPERILNDIKDAFDYFDEDKAGYVSISHLKAILQYVGGGRLSRRELEAYISSMLGTPLRAKLSDVQEVANRIWHDSRESEFKELLKVFDRRDKGETTIEEMKNILQSRIVVPVTEEDMEEMMDLMGVDSETPISSGDLAKLESLLSG
mmetsp:Transcript_10730/g.16054  ORF Transcript_10730/g.16054 Transcript_10730/m.16054 type:complete len:172 (-) Transcript_10730:1909-2424(-)|eukprot:CAMPEP_0202426912 /NCGR_PEP_ID=MMETSP1345-20130828/1220_1 /ASSEMBLY_ACC=CAM_ASM_000843 /TAXON_ID=342563 /ORGANISM="Fabrea Fabrea salina" /LENGTH=171 /DNA_ID=CAMNT_0049037469 /DNA_START=1455 /DNA_END=1970 /DNA_ORIENTATION=+